MLAVALPLLVMGAWLGPVDAGGEAVDRRAQLGLADCGMLRDTGIPCATCGMTTSVTYAVDGRLLDAFTTQPAAAGLAVLAAMVTLVAGWSLIRGVDLGPLVPALLRPGTLVVIIGVVLGAWLYRIATVLTGSI